MKNIRARSCLAPELCFHFPFSIFRFNLCRVEPRQRLGKTILPLPPWRRCIVKRFEFETWDDGRLTVNAEFAAVLKATG